MRRWLAPFWVLGLLLALPVPAAPTPVTVEVTTVAGARLGRLVGESQGGATYYLLADVARLATASTVRGPGADRMRLVSRHGVVQIARDARRITVAGRAVSLSAPVRRLDCHGEPPDSKHIPAAEWTWPQQKACRGRVACWPSDPMP